MADRSRHFLQAQQALKAGHKEEARALLKSLLRAEPDNHRAWLWLAAVAPTPEESLKHIARAERLNPGDPTIDRARAWAEERLAETDRANRESAEKATTSAEGATGSGRRLRPLIFGAALLAVLLIAAALLWLSPGEETTTDEDVVLAEIDGPESVTPSPTSHTGHFAPHSVADAGDPSPSPAPSRERPQQIAAKPVMTREGGAARPTWTVTPSPTATPSPTPTVVPTFVSNDTRPQAVLRPDGVGPNERWIDVNLTAQRLVAYEGNTPVYESLVSSGTYNHPTVTGQFRIWLRFRSQTMDGRRLGYDYYLENVPYVMYFYEDYALHGTYWHNNFGTPMSHGCVNLPTPVAEWIFNWSEMGTLVNVHY